MGCAPDVQKYKNILLFFDHVAPTCRKNAGLRGGGATTCQYLSLFHVSAPLWASYAGLWNADLVAISRRCATLSLLCWTLKCRSCRYFT